MTNTIYDYPLYYDVLFGWDRTREAAFYDRIFELAGIDTRESILEVAAGTGEIAVRLALLGRPVAALDISNDMLACLSEKAGRAGVTIPCACDDMRSFSHSTVYGGAFNPLSSFRLLQTDEDADRHLASMAAAIRSGGVYVLDLDFLETLDDPAITASEEWVMSRDDITIRATNERIFVEDQGRHIELAWGVEEHLRGYTCDSFSRLASRSGCFHIESWHPEAGRSGEEEVSVFDAERSADSYSTGRTMVVLRRR